MAIRHQLWADQEVVILVAAYAKAHKRNHSRFFTSKDWSCILDKVNEYNVQNFNKKDAKQLKNKIDTLIKTHKREQVKQNNSGMPSKWIYFNTMEEIQITKDENYHLYPTSVACKKTSCDFNPHSLLNINQNDGQNKEENLDAFDQFCEFSYDSCDPYSVLDFDQSDGQEDEEGLDILKELGEQQLLCEWEINSQPNLKFVEPIKLSPDSDEFVEEVKRMFAKPTGDIAMLCHFFPLV